MITYRTYKHIFGHELYLCNISVPKFRVALYQLRLSSHSLAIELGRYAPRVPRERRHCTYCNTNALDDEFHFVLICSHHCTLRQRHIPFYYYNRPNMLKFTELMSTENASLHVSLAKYVYYAFKQRQ